MNTSEMTITMPKKTFEEMEERIKNLEMIANEKEILKEVTMSCFDMRSVKYYKGIEPQELVDDLIQKNKNLEQANADQWASYIQREEKLKDEIEKLRRDYKKLEIKAHDVALVLERDLKSPMPATPRKSTWATTFFKFKK
jgi:uncharacterized protein (UPF0335 family)